MDAIAGVRQRFAALESVIDERQSRLACQSFRSRIQGETTDGYILNINTTTGELIVGPQGSTLGAADPAAVKVRLNDPEGRFGLKRNSYDWRFAVDDENSTVRSATGYPMCIPTGTADVECPATNRPAAAGGTLLSRFTMGPVDAMNFLAPGAAAGPGVAPAPSCPTCNANKQVPFALGDRITFAGTLAKDASGVRYISAHTVTAWLGIYTEPLASQQANGRNDPAYLSIEVSLLATGGVPFTGVGQENGPGGGIGATRIKMEIVTTDPTRVVAAFAVDSLRQSAAQPEFQPHDRWRSRLLPPRRPGRRRTR